ncbi:redox-sensing transcriptional repressor Rex [Propionibacteriaceae bacterium G1746]
MSDQAISGATIGRLPIYLRALGDMSRAGATTVSSEALAAATGVQSSLVRRDLAQFGSYGIRGVGYNVATLSEEIQHLVGAHKLWKVALVGAGNLGHALVRHFGLSADTFTIVAIVDINPDVVGTTMAGVTVTHQADLADTLRRTGAELAIIATPASAAQQVADALVEAGVHSLLNMAPITLHVPESVTVRSVDFTQELLILSYHEAHRSPPAATADASTKS